MPSYLFKRLKDLKIGTYENIVVTTTKTPLIVALHQFVEKKVSALPVVDERGKLVDIYAKFDVIVSHYCLQTHSASYNIFIKQSITFSHRIWQLKKRTIT